MYEQSGHLHVNHVKKICATRHEGSEDNEVVISLHDATVTKVNNIVICVKVGLVEVDALDEGG